MAKKKTSSKKNKKPNNNKGTNIFGAVRESSTALRKTAEHNQKQVERNDTEAQQSKADARKAIDTLNAQVASNPVYDTSNPFGFITNENTIQNRMDEATRKAYDVKRQEAAQALNAAEDTSYANTQEAVRGLKNSMATSTASGANRGAAGANAVQALLGLGQQNNQLVTQGLQNMQNVVAEKAAAMAQNASDAIDKSNAARGQQAGAANEKYSADQGYRAEAAKAVGSLASSMHTDAVNKEMNDATNAANQTVAAVTGKWNNRAAKTTGRYNVKAAKTTGKYSVQAAKAGRR